VQERPPSLTVAATIAAGHGFVQNSAWAKHLRVSDPDLCKIDILAWGHGVVEQRERESRLAAGDLTLVDFSRPVRWTMSSSQMIAVIFPASCCPSTGSGRPASWP
jgi:hypothetical protein